METDREGSGLGVEVATIEKPRSLGKSLRKLYFLQAMELGKFRKQISDPQDIEALSDCYIKSSGFSELKKETQEKNINIHRLRGRVFEDLAFLDFALSQTNSEILLSLKRTRRFFKEIFPEAIDEAHPVGQDSLHGISLPDGILVRKDGLIIALVEYTLHAPKDVLEETIKHKSFMKLKESHPNLFIPNAKFILVLPKIDEKEKIPVEILQDQYERLEIEHVPFSRSEISIFLENNGLIGKDEDKTTLNGLNLLDRYIKTSEFKKRYREIVELEIQDLPAEDRLRMKAMLREEIFGDLVKIYLRRDSGKNRALLSRKEKKSSLQKPYRKNYPTVVMPDRMTFDPNEDIIKVIECASSLDLERFREKYEKFAALKRYMLRNRRLVFVIPNVPDSELETIKNTLRDETIEFVMMPFSAEEFDFFIDDPYGFKHRLDENSAIPTEAKSLEKARSI